MGAGIRRGDDSAVSINDIHFIQEDIGERITSPIYLV